MSGISFSCYTHAPPPKKATCYVLIIVARQHEEKTTDQISSVLHRSRGPRCYLLYLLLRTVKPCGYRFVEPAGVIRFSHSCCFPSIVILATTKLNNEENGIKITLPTFPQTPKKNPIFLAETSILGKFGTSVKQHFKKMSRRRVPDEVYAIHLFTRSPL